MSASLKKKVDGQFVEIGSSAKVFRGEWEADAQLASFNFHEGTPPAGVVPSTTGVGMLEYPFVQPSGSPFARSLFLRLDNPANANGALATIDLDGYVNVSRVEYTAMGSPRANHSYAQFQHRTLVNGADAVPGRGLTFTWDNYSVTASDGDVVTIWIDGQWGNNTLGRTEMGMYVHTIRVYGRAEPYLEGQFVTYEGKMWKSEINDNTSTPGDNATWTETLALLNPSGTTAERPTASTAGSGYYYYDTTLGRPIWSNGTAWTDAAGVVV